MKLGIALLIVFLALEAYAGERNYRSGVLKQIEIKDVTGTFPISATSGQSIALPFGIDYQFQVQSDMIVYVGNCFSKDKRSYGSEWVVNDPVFFRIEKDKLFLKRSSKGELRLALMLRLRVLPKKEEDGSMKSSVEPLPPFAGRQTVPQCQ